MEQGSTDGPSSRESKKSLKIYKEILSESWDILYFVEFSVNKSYMQSATDNYVLKSTKKNAIDAACSG